MHADDLCSIVEGTNLVTILDRVQAAMNVFAKFSGQMLNLIKCGIVIKGVLTHAEKNHIEVTTDKRLLRGIPIVESVKYLGVRMGNVTSDFAFAFPLGKPRGEQIASLHTTSPWLSEYCCLKRGFYRVFCLQAGHIIRRISQSEP